MTGHADKLPLGTILRRAELKELAAAGRGPHVSLYLPTHRKGPQTRQDPIRLKNLLREAKEQLADTARGATDGLLEPLAHLLDDSEFWRHRTEGLALFRDSRRLRRYDLPFACEERVVVGPRFHVKPIVPLLYTGARFFMLALSQNTSTLFECGGWGARELPVRLPSLDESLAEEVDDKQLQFHSQTPPAAASGGKRPSIFHGTGGTASDPKDRASRHFRNVDRVVCEALEGEAAPLVLAAVDYLHPIYHEANHYDGLIDAGLTGNPENVPAGDLLEEAREIVEPLLDRDRREALEHYATHAGTEDGRGTADWKVIVPAACHGRVDTLFVALGEQRWGAFDPPSGKLHLRGRPGGDAEDLLNLAVVHTLGHGGKAWALERERMPGGAAAAAVLRY